MALKGAPLGWALSLLSSFKLARNKHSSLYVPAVRDREEVFITFLSDSPVPGGVQQVQPPALKFAGLQAP